MNIWIFNHYAITPDLPGGTRHYDLSKELVKRGHHIVIFATSFHYTLHRETRLQPGENWKIEDVDGVKFVWLRTPPYWRNDWRRVRNMVVYMFRAWWLGRKLPKLSSEIKKPDIIIGSSVHLLAVLAAYWLSKYYKVPFVMEVRDLWPQTFIDMGKLSPQHPITKALQILEKFLYNRAEKIITPLSNAHEYITNCGIPREKVVWIPNGVDLSRFNNNNVYPERSNNDFNVMYVGAHGLANGLETLIQAAKIVQDSGYQKVRFILVGDGPEKPNLIDLAERLNLKNVEFRDPVPKDKVPNVFKEADVFVPNLERGQVFKYGVASNKLFDYMGIGKPIIFPVQFLDNPVQEAQCGLTVPPGDPEALAEAIIKLYQMPPEERKAMGNRGREYVEKYHDIRKLADRLETVLSDILEKQQ